MMGFCCSHVPHFPPPDFGGCPCGGGFRPHESDWVTAKEIDAGLSSSGSGCGCGCRKKKKKAASSRPRWNIFIEYSSERPRRRRRFPSPVFRPRRRRRRPLR